jgi:hypothetical protein
VKEKIISYTTLHLNKKTSFILILIFTTIVVFDSTIVNFSSYSGVEPPTSLNVAIFIIFSTIFVTSSIILLNSLRKIMSKHAYKPLRGLRYFYSIIISTQILTIAIILMIILQMILLNRYSLILLRAETYLSHLSALVFISFLIFFFAGWLTSKRNYITMLYIMSFSLVSVNLVISLIYLESYFSISLSADVKPYSIISYVTNIFSSTLTELLSLAFRALSLSSFLLMWIATAILLSQYRYKMGRIRYFLLVSIPLIYYIFPFSDYFGDVLYSFRSSSPVTFSIIYLLIFSATKQVGALLFSLSFWTASSLVYDDRIRKSLLMSSIGMAILFGSIELTPLQYRVYPPYGFITEAFIPLGAYLLFIGIFTSAKHISQDAEVRKEFYKSAASQLGLLRTIGVSQMQKELEKKVKFIEEHSRLEKTDDVQLEEGNVKEILRDVLNELYSKSKEEPQKS